jgi:site-specific recombinase XerD
MRQEKEIDYYFEVVKSNYKASTVFVYSKHIESIKKALDYAKIKSLKRLDIDSCYKMVEYFKRYTKIKNSTINKRIRMIKRIVEFYDLNISFRKFRPLRDDTVSYQRFYEHELRKIVQYCKHLNRNSNSLPIKAITYLFIDSGMRFSEMLNVKIQDISFNPRRIYLGITKNGKPRYAPFGLLAEQELKDYIMMDPTREYLAWNFNTNTIMTKNCLRAIYRRIAKKLEISSIHPHRFRKTMASMLLENGMNIIDLQVLLDHSDIETTMIYAQFKEERALKEYDRFSNWMI